VKITERMKTYDIRGIGRPRSHWPRYKPPWPKFTRWNLRMPAIARMIASDEPVLDVGCGTGILGAVLWHQGHRAPYVGVDLSDAQLEWATGGNAESGHQLTEFHKDNVGSPGFFERYWKLGYAVVFAEILEHLKGDGDLKALRSVPAGVHVLITAPTFTAKTHYHIFSESGEEGIVRYSPYVEVRRHETVRFNPRRRSAVAYHLLDCVRRNSDG
jgi:SAM-dependent methyltransferase